VYLLFSPSNKLHRGTILYGNKNYMMKLSSKIMDRAWDLEDLPISLVLSSDYLKIVTIQGEEEPNVKDRKLSSKLIVSLVLNCLECLCYFLRDHVERGNIMITHVRTEDQVADLFTKQLGRIPFVNFRLLLDLIPSSSS